MSDATRSLLDVERLARTQHGVVSREQARELGVDPRRVSRLLASGRWRAHLGRLLVPAVQTVSDAADAMALTLRLGAPSAVTGPTALRLQGVEVPDQLLAAWAPRPSMPRVGGVRLLRDDAPREVREVRRLRLVTPVDALIDTLLLVTVQRSEELLDTALQRRWLSSETWLHTVPARLGRGRTGAARLRALGPRITEGTHSDGERRCAAIFRRAGITGWVANYLLRDEWGRPTAELDFAFPDLLLCVEVDGRAAHSTDRAFERDRRRQNALTLGGWTVLRFTWQQVAYEPDTVATEVRAAITACRLRRSA